jgi:hypothetical protein
LATVATVAGTISTSVLGNDTTGTFGFTVQLQDGKINDAYLKLSGVFGRYEFAKISVELTALDFRGGKGTADTNGYRIGSFSAGNEMAGYPPPMKIGWENDLAKSNDTTLFYNGPAGNRDAFSTANTVPANYRIGSRSVPTIIDAGAGTGTVTRN